jgi:hypothetical protein
MAAAERFFCALAELFRGRAKFSFSGNESDRDVRFGSGVPPSPRLPLTPGLWRDKSAWQAAAFAGSGSI